MARKETARVVRQQIATLQQEREALISRRRRLDDEIASVDTDIQNLETVLQPNSRGPGGSRPPSPLAVGTADLVCELLTEAGTPLHYRTIYERLRDREPRLPQSDDPATALLARYFNDQRLHRTAPGTYALRKAPVSPPVEESVTRDDSPLTGKHPTGYVLMGTHYDARNFRGVLTSVCETLYDLDPETFRRVLTDTSTYRFFSEDGEELWSPKPIGNSGLYVQSQMSAKNIDDLCRRVIRLMGLDDGDFAIEAE